MIFTGVGGLDELLGGGIPPGSRVLYSLEPGVDGQLFMISSLSWSLEQGLSCMVILPHATVDAFRNDIMTSCGTRISPEKGASIIFLDAIDRERIQKSAKSPAGQAREWQIRIRKICTEHHVDVVFAYLDLFSEDFGLDLAIRTLQSCELEKIPTVFVEQLNMEGQPLLDQFIHDFSFDLVVAVRASFRPIPYFSYFTIVHTGWAPAPVRSIPFIIADQQIVSYIPRIVVTGPEQSGKSTFVGQAAEDESVLNRKDREGESVPVATDYGQLRWKDFDISLYGTPGHNRFDPVIPKALRHAMGAVVLIDATRPDTLPLAGEIIAKILERRIPFVVGATKSDLPGGMDAETIRQQLNLAKGIPVYPISAKERSDVHHVLESLVDYITQYAP